MTYRLTPERLLDMAEARLRGASISEIARTYRMSWWSVRERMGRLVPGTFSKNYPPASICLY